jgi:uncharacterized membrane protein (UPF0136 family)
MPCCLALIALAAPRITLVLVWIFSDYLGRAYETVLVPLLGFFFLPTTTLAYAWAINARGEVSGLPLAVVVLAALIDLGAIGGSRRRKPAPRE